MSCLYKFLSQIEGTEWDTNEASKLVINCFVLIEIPQFAIIRITIEARAPYRVSIVILSFLMWRHLKFKIVIIMSDL